MDFCEKCGSIMVPEKGTKHTYMVCRGCGYKTKKNVRGLKIKEDIKSKKDVIILEENKSNLPITDIMCPKCGNMKAYWWLQQTRSADEPPTQFFRCTDCKHVWREYK